jgi:ABC-type sugar transport system permease subunit
VAGLLLLVPALATWLWSYLLPTITTVTRGFQRYNLVGPPRSAGTRNYEDVFQHALGSIWSGLLLVLVPLIAGLLVAPALAVSAHRAGRTARRVTLALTAIPLVSYAPVALALGWFVNRRSQLGATRDAAQGTDMRVVGWTSVGLIVAVGTTLALAALRGRRPVAATLAVGGVVALGVFGAGLQLFTIPEVTAVPTGHALSPMLQIYRNGLVSFNLGLGAAWSTLLLIVLAVLGIAAVAVLLAVRARVEYAPAAGTEPAAPTVRPVPAVVTAVLLILLFAVVGYALWPWLGSMFGGTPLPKGFSTTSIVVDTWLPPLLSAFVAVFVALLAGIGIGAFRPLGAYSELLLLIFAPWLFVGTGPLALAGYERARDMKQLNTFAGLIPPSWLSIPALVMFALLFRGLSQQWRAAGGGYQRLGGMVALPALPALGGVLLLVWLAGAQQLLWPWLIGTTSSLTPAGPLAVNQTIAQYSIPRPGTHSSAIGLVYPPPLLLLFALAFVALGIWYLERLAIQVGPESRRVPPPPPPVPGGAWQRATLVPQGPPQQPPTGNYEARR